ncbi:MAG: type II toxin-antitoxin system HicA family toxin [Candidatus Korobacteraceae bacterium]
MSRWPSTKAGKVLRALGRIGWSIKAYKASSHVQLIHPKPGEYTWAFDDSDELGPAMLAKISKKTGLKREDL